MRRLQGRTRHAAFIGVMLVLLLRAAFALGDVSVAFMPAAPRAGENVDVTEYTFLYYDRRKIPQRRRRW